MHLPPVYYVFTGIFVLGLISPGPDFALVTRNTLIYSRSIGRWTSVGIASGILVHVTYCLLGIGFLIERSILLFSVIKVAGAVYLVYLGVRALLHKRKDEDVAPVEPAAPLETIDPRKALQMGFVTNVLNPKVTVLFVSLFTQVLGPRSSVAIRFLYGSQMCLFTLIWFMIVATAFAYIARAKGVQSFLSYVEKATGIALISFGARLAFARPH